MKGNKKVLIYLISFVLIFSLFIFILLRPSAQSKAIKEINTCANVEDVKASWYKYRTDLGDDNDYCQAVRDKLLTFGLKQAEVTDIKKWLPSKTKNLNVIVVPDLSLRINDNLNNPDQIKNDTTILSTIWHSFKTGTRLKMNTKDRLLFDVADPSQAQDQFKVYADNLLFDLSNHKSKTNRLYFTENIENRFHSNINDLYKLATQKTSGADYVYYFSNKLPTRLKKSTLDDDYRNILIIITDGYLEIGKGTSISPNPSLLRRYCSTGVLDYSLPTQTIDLTYPDLEVYLFEINERQSGKGCDYRGLKKWWTEWLKSMQIANVSEDFIFRRQDAMNLTEDEVKKIFAQK